MTESRQLAPAQEIRHTLDKMTPQFQAALPTHIKPEKFIRVAATAIQTIPDLVAADRQSLYAACTKAAQDGLLPDGREAALTVFNTKVKIGGRDEWIKKVQYMPMIAGILKKLRNSGELSSIVAQVIYENDVKNGNFKYWIDSDGEHLEYRPDMFSDRGQIIGAFAMAKLTDGALYVTVMTKVQIEQVRAVSRAKDSGPWVAWWDQMAEKTVLRRLSKRLPMSTDIDGLFGDEPDYENVVAVGAAPEARETHDVTPPPEEAPEPKNPRQSRARAAVEAKRAYTVEEMPDDGTVIDGESEPVDGPPEDDGDPGNDGDEVPI